MIRSTDRIMITHAGALPRPDDLRDLVFARSAGREYDAALLSRRLRESVAEAVQKQVESGIDSVNDGELSKTNFTNYVRERLSGFETRSVAPGEGPPPLMITGRDIVEFPEYFAAGLGGFAAQPGFAGRGPSQTQVFCTGPLQYSGMQDLQTDIGNFRAALQGVNVAEAYLPANTPGTIEHWLRNEYYKSDEEFLEATADVMREEYEAIVNAGFLLQIDDPDLPDGWQIYPDMSREEYHKYADLRVEALNFALKNVPENQIRFHTCWGSQHGPHMDDIELKYIIDLIFKIKAECYSVEAANPQHDHDWHVFETVKLAPGKSYMPGVTSHVSNTIEHPQLVADRLIRYAKLMGKENVIAGTDCGMGSRVGHPEVAWAKFNAMVEGSKIATKELWGK
jgi:5-methyltetrahydropteroyltriglutamate--homocysteine methyltransferase